MLHQFHALAGGDAVSLEEDVELALSALFVPSLLDRRSPLLADAIHEPQAARLLACLLYTSGMPTKY